VRLRGLRVGLYRRGRRGSSWHRRGCLPILASSEVDDVGAEVEVLTGRRRPKERREEEDGELRVKPPLFARG